MDAVKSDGGSTSYYEMPTGAKELQDLIEHKDMNFAVANIFKAAYRLGEKAATDRSYDLKKIIWFAERELARAGITLDMRGSYDEALVKALRETATGSISNYVAKHDDPGDTNPPAQVNPQATFSWSEPPLPFGDEEYPPNKYPGSYDD